MNNINYLSDKYILGIDPGLSIIGYGIFRITHNNQLVYFNHGNIKTFPKNDITFRLNYIHDEMNKLLHTLVSDNVYIYVEQVFHSANTKTVNVVNYALGIILKTIYLHPYNFIFPSSVKKFLGLVGGKNKKQIFIQMTNWFKILAGQKNKNDDAIDALAIAFTGYYKHPPIFS